MKTFKRLRILILCAVTILSTSGLFAQEDGLDSANWISVDIPRVNLQRSAARPTQQAFLNKVSSIANPNIPEALLCRDLDVIFVLDESGSIAGTEVTSVRDGAMALANALLNSGAKLTIIDFNTESHIVDLGGTDVNNTFISRLNSYLYSNYNGQQYLPPSSPTNTSNCNGWTNWQDALEDVASIKADLVIFFTDGNPTAYNTPDLTGNCIGKTVKVGASASTALDPAITAANAVKAQSKHMFLVGVGNASELNLDNIKSISGPDAFGPDHNILTADYTQPPYEQLAANLTAAVNAICGTTLTIKKTSSKAGVCAGQSVIFTNTVTNTGGSFNFTALNVQAKDVYPNGYSNFHVLVPVPAGSSYIISGDTVKFSIGDLAAGQSFTYQVQATVDAPPGNYKNLITAAANNADEVRDSVSVTAGIAKSELNISSCEPVVINGTTYSATGQYTQTIKNGSVAGCDSVITINIISGTPSKSTEIISVCGDSYQWHGDTYTTSSATAGTWTGKNAAGCDSVVTLDLTLRKATASTETISICGDSYQWHGDTYTTSSATAGTWTGKNAAGCDSVVTLDLTLRKATASTETISICGDSYQWHGDTYTTSSATAGTWTGKNAAGCDSVVTLDLTLRKATASTETISICGDSYQWHGDTYTTSSATAGTWTGKNAAGCDSVVTLDLTLRKATASTETISICGDSYQWHGDTYTTSSATAGTWTGKNAAGCDSVVTLDLTLRKATASTETISICGDSYQWHGDTYTTSSATAGTWTGKNAAGCDSLVTLDLTLRKVTASTETISICGDSYQWHGNTYTTSSATAGTWKGKNAAGCDSVVTLNLTLNKTSASTETIAACNSYVWHGKTYTESNTTDKWTGKNAAGCDSVVTLNLTINKAPSIGPITGSGNVCRNQTGVKFSVAAVSNATSYTWTLPSGVTGTSTTNSITVAIGSTFSTGIIKVHANNNCGSSADVQITITSPTAVPAVPCAITGPTSYCVAGNYTYSIIAIPNATGYTWTLTGTGLSIVSGQGTTSIIVAATAACKSGTISVKATNCLGSSCSASTINVSSAKAPATPGVISGPTTGVCNKSGVVYSVAAVTGATSYSWTVPAGASITSGANTNSIKVTFGASLTGNCSITVKANNACGSSAASSLAVSVLPAAPGAITGSATVSKSQCSVTYSIVAVADATSYTWTITGGAKFVGSATGKSVVVNFMTATSSSAVLTVKANNACGSSAASAKTIKVNASRALIGSNEDLQLSTNIKAYPNPSNGNFSVSFSTNKSDKVGMTITDIAGHMIYRSVNTYAAGAHLNKINVSKFAKGVYFVHISRNDKEEKSIKVFVQ